MVSFFFVFMGDLPPRLGCLCSDGIALCVQMGRIADCGVPVVGGQGTIFMEEV